MRLPVTRVGGGSGWGRLGDHIITIYINNTWTELIITTATVQRMVNVDERSENQYRVLLRTATGPQSSRISSINSASFLVRSHTPVSCIFNWETLASTGTVISHLVHGCDSDDLQDIKIVWIPASVFIGSEGSRN